jgi:hypothetical protein
LEQLRAHPNIGQVIVKDLDFNQDKIYAGINNSNLVSGLPQLGYDFLIKTPEAGTGHFYYAPSSEIGVSRRRELAQELYNYGLR